MLGSSQPPSLSEVVCAFLAVHLLSRKCSVRAEHCLLTHTLSPVPRTGPGPSSLLRYLPSSGMMRAVRACAPPTCSGAPGVHCGSGAPGPAAGKGGGQERCSRQGRLPVWGAPSAWGERSPCSSQSSAFVASGVAPSGGLSGAPPSVRAQEERGASGARSEPLAHVPRAVCSQVLHATAPGLR